MSKRAERPRSDRRAASLFPAAGSRRAPSDSLCCEKSRRAPRRFPARRMNLATMAKNRPLVIAAALTLVASLRS